MEREENHSQRQRLQEQEKHEHFIPGLADEIVLRHIATKIPWSTMYTLTSVNREWRRAIRSRKIYKARKDSGTLQLVAVTHLYAWRFVDGLLEYYGFCDLENLDLYLFPSALDSRLESSWVHRELEKVSRSGSIPVQDRNTEREIIKFVAHTVQLDGKIYGLREVLPRYSTNTLPGLICELDVGAFEREWKNHFNYNTVGRTEIFVACNAKLYLFRVQWGLIQGKSFDPQNGKWKEIEDRPTISCPLATYRKFFHPLVSSVYHYGKVAVLGNDIYLGWTPEDAMMVFNSVTEKWRTIPITLQVPDSESEALLSYGLSMTVIDDKMYNFSSSCVNLYDPESNSWTLLQHYITPDEDPIIIVKAAATSGNEVIAWVQSDRDFKLCKSMNFGDEESPLVWETLPPVNLMNRFGNNYYDTFPISCFEL